MEVFPAKVVILSWEFPPRIVGGIASHVYELSRNLSMLGVDVTIITFSSPETKKYENMDGVEIFRVPLYDFPAPDFASKILMGNLNIKQKAIEILKASKDKPKIIHAHDWLVAIAAISLKNLFKIPLVTTIHSTEYGRTNGLPSNYNKMIHQIESWLVSESLKVICCSKYMSQSIRKEFGVEDGKITVIHNGVNFKKFRRKGNNYNLNEVRSLFVGSNEKLILFVGRLIFEKGLNVLLEAFPKVLQKVDAKLVVVGDGYLREEILKKALSYGFPDKVCVTGFLNEETLNQLYMAADVCVVPSLYEPFGIVALEAMAAKTPVVVSDVGGLSEIVRHKKTGIKVQPNNPVLLASSILEVLEGGKHVERMVKNAYKEIVDKYSWRVVAEKTKSLYVDILNHVSKLH
ncbi:MAG: glycosyltransferase family 4 protein [Candidatus Bathyarchaeota archaeon]